MTTTKTYAWNIAKTEATKEGIVLTFEDGKRVFLNDLLLYNIARYHSEEWRQGGIRYPAVVFDSKPHKLMVRCA